MPNRLGIAYAQLVQLGGFLETDIRVQQDTLAMDRPLDADIHGLLTALVRTAGRWLRGFPTIANWDDAENKGLVRPDLFQPAQEFVQIVRAHQAISAQDALEMMLLAEAADATSYQGRKAGNRSVGSASNLFLSIALILSDLTTPGIVARPQLIQRVRTALAAAKDQVELLAATRPNNLRQALRSLIRESWQTNQVQEQLGTGTPSLHRSSRTPPLGHQDSDNNDYKNGRLFVFDDRLEFSEDIKHQLETTLDYPFNDPTTFGASVEPSVLTAENKRRPDGSRYVLIRKATFSEERQLFANDDDDDEEVAVKEGNAGANAAIITVNGPVTGAHVHRVLAFFIDIEPEPDEIDSVEEYEALMEKYRDQIKAGNRTLRDYGAQIEVKTLSNMQEVYYSFTNDPRYLERSLWVAVVRSTLSKAWDGVGLWRR